MRRTVAQDRSTESSRSYRCARRRNPEREPFRRASPLRRLELQRDAVHAVAIAGRRGPIGEDVSEMPAAVGTVDLDARHAVGGIGGGPDGAFNRSIKARPAGPALVFRLRGEERLPATGAAERSGALLLEQWTGAAVLGAVFAQDVELLRREERLPVGFGLCFRFFCHLTRTVASPVATAAGPLNPAAGSRRAARASTTSRGDVRRPARSGTGRAPRGSTAAVRRWTASAQSSATPQ